MDFFFGGGAFFFLFPFSKQIGRGNISAQQSTFFSSCKENTGRGFCFPDNWTRLTTAHQYQSGMGRGGETSQGNDHIGKSNDHKLPRHVMYKRPACVMKYSHSALYLMFRKRQWYSKILDFLRDGETFKKKKKKRATFWWFFFVMDFFFFNGVAWRFSHK